MAVSAAGSKTKLDLVFGEVLPDSTSDDRPWPADADSVQHTDSLQHTESDERDQWLRDNRPPHHDTA
ncbi:MAG: hypothetical protein M3Y48_25470 [Actinomycetota bacterium]|nr:hypothetical protein [Actinomycetota bacterium]